MYKHITYQIADKVATISLNRPERYNALIASMNEEILHALKDAQHNQSVRVLVLTGSGKAFCSGQDVQSIQSGLEHINFMESLEQYYTPIITTIVSMPKPVICKLNGVAAGAGCSLALACDIIVASEKASMIQAFVNIGLVIDAGASYFLPRLVGSRKAFELATMGNKISAQEAVQMGLITAAVPHQQLEEATAKYLNYYKNAATKAVGFIKKLLQHSSHSDLQSMLHYEAVYQELVTKTKDAKEGVTAFTEKRKAEFLGE